MSAVLEIKHFYKTYKNGKKAVEDLNLSVQPGEIYGFIGQNGAGKTTTIRAVTDVYKRQYLPSLITNSFLRQE